MRLGDHVGRSSRHVADQPRGHPAHAQQPPDAAAGQGDPVPELLRISKLAGMSEADFKACLGNQDLLTKIIEGRNKAVKDFSVQATPTVFVNGEKLGDSSVESLSKMIDAAL